MANKKKVWKQQMKERQERQEKFLEEYRALCAKYELQITFQPVFTKFDPMRVELRKESEEKKEDEESEVEITEEETEEKPEEENKD